LLKEVNGQMFTRMSTVGCTTSNKKTNHQQTHERRPILMYLGEQNGMHARRTYVVAFRADNACLNEHGP